MVFNASFNNISIISWRSVLIHLIYIFIWRDILQRSATFTIYTAFSIAVLVNGRSQWPWYHTVIRCHLLNIESKISQACTSTFQIINSDFYKYQEIATMNISAMSIHLCMSYTHGLIFYNKHRYISLTYDDEVQQEPNTTNNGFRNIFRQ